MILQLHFFRVIFLLGLYLKSALEEYQCNSWGKKNRDTRR